jgi:hypothetical protein
MTAADVEHADWLNNTYINIYITHHIYIKYI